MNEEQYLDLMAASAMLGLLTYSTAEKISIDKIARISYNFAEAMWAERERRLEARAALNGEK